jgi:hypothetical protein
VVLSRSPGSKARSTKGNDTTWTVWVRIEGIERKELLASGTSAHPVRDLAMPAGFLRRAGIIDG